MTREEIVTRLSLKLVSIAASPNEIVHAVGLQSVLIALAHRLGEEALTLSAADLLEVRDQVRTAIKGHLVMNELITVGLDVWAARRKEVLPCWSPVILSA